MVSPPDLFFTYMSHRFPRLIANSARVSFVNSMHGVRLRPGARWARRPLSVLTLNSLTMLGAEIGGRSYGGGILKMEPREAAVLPVPHPEIMQRAWSDLQPDVAALEEQLRRGEWAFVVDRIDDVLLSGALGLKRREIARFRDGISLLRGRRLGPVPA
jgi:adenine-specific DNA-methyltransferase